MTKSNSPIAKEKYKKRPPDFEVLPIEYFKGRDIKESKSELLKNDALNRGEEINAIHHSIVKSETPFTLCVNAPWGFGKTTFLKLLERYLQIHDGIVLKFNAWENDYCEDPFVPLFGQIYQGIKDWKNRDGEKLGMRTQGLKTQATKVIQSQLPTLAKTGVGLAGKLLLSTFVKDSQSFLSALEVASVELKDAIDTDALRKALESKGDDWIESYLAESQSLIEFNKALENFTEEVQKNGHTNSDLPLVVLVDELDRCRPTFAIETLERIKHLFGVPGIVFILALDKEQLGESLKMVYGQGMDTRGYLRRFIDEEIKLSIKWVVGKICG